MPSCHSIVATLGFLAALLLAAACGGQELTGSAELQSLDLPLEGFDTINVSDTFDAIVEVGDGFSVTVIANENLVEHLMVEVSGETLQVGLSDDVSVGDADLEVLVTLPELVAMDVSGASSAEVLGVFGPQQSYVASGASEILVEGTAGALNLEASGASSIQVLGEAQRLTVTAAGASDIDSDVGGVAAAVVDVSGASSVDLETAAVVAGDLSGASDLTVPQVATVQVEVSGDSVIDLR